MITFANDEGDLHILALKPKRKLSSGWMEFKDFRRKHSLVWSGSGGGYGSGGGDDDGW